MATAANLGFPRIGANRELKKATEAYWAQKIPAEALLATARDIRRQNWTWQSEVGIEQIPSGDFSLYDHVLDTAVLVDAIPPRFREFGLTDELDLYFAMARGSVAAQPLEMTKWFDTNYHYLVPEFTDDQEFGLARTAPIDSFREAKALGFAPRPVLLGPVSFLLLGKIKNSHATPLHLLDRLIPVYEELLKRLASEGAEWVQIDEPVLATDLDEATIASLAKTLGRLAAAAPRLNILLAAYFRGPDQLEAALQNIPDHLTLSLGLIGGRNIWKTDLARALETAERAARQLCPDRVMIAPSCSLLHVPVDLSLEHKLSPEVKDWMAFGRQKLEEVAIIAESLRKRRRSPLVRSVAIRQRLSALDGDGTGRKNPYSERRQAQEEVLNLPVLPTTTIGSFPQTASLRQQRAQFRKGELTAAQYDNYIREEITRTIRQQEALGLDVLVHGEPERNDMVEYFGELLDGFAFTENGWVQSYGSRCVKPPVIYGDIVRRGPMTVDWWRFAQSLTPRPVKGMLTGPVTILEWSFVRDDQPRKDTCFQLALAIREEILDLEKAGCKIIQVDEPALREGMPLRKADAPEYLRWAVEAFRLATGGVRDETQIHTHMCYAEFNEIIDAIAAMDADVISMESARSQMELLDAFAGHEYTNEIGPGVYDIHSPRVPSADEMASLLAKALQVIPANRLWVNPDCGLKTRRWEEVLPALTNLVGAAARLRASACRGL
jgi:5-methyltetrahydropteroyltriglutamate--homocysteine methyltransferase